MLKTIIISAAVCTFAGAAIAGDLCKGGPRDQWLTQEQIAERLEPLGYTEFTLSVEDGCIEAVSNQHGSHMEFYMEPLTGEIVKTEQE